MDGRRDGRRLLRPSFHLYLLASTLTVFFAQVPLGLFAAQSPLDSTAHVLLPAAATSLLYDAFYHRVVHSPAQYFGTMALLGVSTEMFWEVLEFGGDAAFGLTWQVDNADTMTDIICGIVGASVGAGIRLWIWTRARRTGTVQPRIQYRRSGTRGRVVATGKIGVVGAAVAVVLAPPGYLAYLAWAMPPVPQIPVMATTLSIAAAMVPQPVRPAGTAPALAPAAVSTSAVSASVPVPSVGAPVPVGPTPGFAAVAPGGRHVYVANRATGVITVVDTAVNRVTATIPVPLGPPQYLTFSPDGRTVYLSIWDEARTISAIGVLDTMTNAVVASVPVRSRPYLAAVSPDSRQLYVPDHDSVLHQHRRDRDHPFVIEGECPPPSQRGPIVSDGDRLTAHPGAERKRSRSAGIRLAEMSDRAVRQQARRGGIEHHRVAAGAHRRRVELQDRAFPDQVGGPAPFLERRPVSRGCDACGGAFHRSRLLGDGQCRQGELGAHFAE